MSVRSSIEDGIRAWLVLAGANGGIPSPDSSVIYANQDAPRPALPYLTVRVFVYDVQVHEDESLIDDSDPPLWRGRGQRTSTVSVNGYGIGADEWMERAVFMLRSPSVVASLNESGLAVRPVSGMNNLSGILDESTQVRFQRDFGVDYQRDSSETDVEELAELELVEHEDDYVDRVVTEVIDLS